MNKKNIIVIPCYNEEKRLNQTAYLASLQQLPELTLLFVNDGSKDNTIEILQNLAATNPVQISFLNLKTNQGKAGAVYYGITEALKHHPEYIGFIDADLAVSLEEFQNLLDIARNEKKDFVFGARWRRIGSNISRKISRHYSGRVFATIASNLLNLSVYDTQCGAKVFTKDIAEKITASPFNVSWIFDVEIFFRLLRHIPNSEFDKHCLEVPLKEWRDVDGSKVKFSHSFRVMTDFWKLRKLYR